MAGLEDWGIDQREEEIEALKAIFEDDVIIESQNHIRVLVNLNLPDGMKYLTVSLDHERCDLHGAKLKTSKSELQLRHLTPLTMNITLPQDYPREIHPEVSLDCFWLNSHLKKILYSEIVKIFKPGMPVIYEWIDWLKDSCMNFLELPSYAVLYLDETSADEFKTLYNFDKKEHLKSFENSIHSCLVCFNELPGSDFVLLPQCQHCFCKGCIQYICSLNVTEGTLANLVCPEGKCDEEIPPSIIKSVLSAKLYERWEKLTLSKCLDRMADLQYCPRCEKASLQDSDTMGRCYHCNFVFCMTCREKWHAGEACFQGEVADENPNKLKKIPKLFWKDYAYVMLTSKRCPNCNLAVTKISGCNSVRCSVCQCLMCWACGQKINGHVHFLENPTCCSTVDLDKESQRSEMNFTKMRKKLQNLGKAFFSFNCTCGVKNYQINRLSNFANCVSCDSKICFDCCAPFQESVETHYTPSKKRNCRLENTLGRK